MKAKLILDIDDSIIEKAKSFSKDKGISLSEMVENYLEFITQYDDKVETQANVIENSASEKLSKSIVEEKDFSSNLEKRILGNFTWPKTLLTIFLFGIATIGFMMKLPSTFHNYDKQLHALFYFLAAAFLNILFAKRKFIIHVAIFIFLSLFGVAIEYAQEFSNKFFHNRIHGRYDIEDIKYNLYGLVLFSIVWAVYIIIVLLNSKLKVNKNLNANE